MGSGVGRVRRAAVHLGHALLVGPRAAHRDADRARHRDLHLRAVPGLAAAAAGRSSPSCSPRFRRSSTACGASSCWCRRCARSSVRLPACAAATAALQRPAARRRHARGRADPRGHGHPVHLVGRARGAEGGADRRSARRAYALGATRWEAIRAALFYARTGIIGAVMLGFGRALGETMAVTMVIGNNPQVSRRCSRRSTRWPP